MTSPEHSGRMEFHVSRKARDRYGFDQALFASSGNVIFTNFRASRLFAQKINQKRNLVSFPEQAVKAGQINAMGLIDEILHYVAYLFRRQRDPQVMAAALAYLEEQLGADAVTATLQRFCDAFPPIAVYRREITAEAYLAGETGGIANRQLALEELLLLWLANVNPAFAPFLELFDDAELEKNSAYPAVIAGLRAFFATQPPFGPDNETLVEMLRAPAIACPHSLAGQLEYILTRWRELLGTFLYRLLSSLDLIKEEEKASFLGPGPALVPTYEYLLNEYERFSEDRDWMPRAVLMAKNAYVWLDQLSKKYGRHIQRLDEIPDEELDTLARWGFTGLWLIGLWERSRASQQIKQWTGNPEAVASAYSIYEYRVADDLGGEAAIENLRARAWQRGIRMASDMVPNHMGVDSPWVMEHPDWFIGLDYAPFPSYSYSGVSLSGNDRVGVYLEDHYFSRDDAAVAFKRVDHWSGETRYIYHGNDGTSMPWNDTAQLNYLNAAVREAVIQTILHVARQFPIIRFDAAMTLAKKHYQRLWYPEPGTGGAIPSRAEHGLTRAQFDAAFPEEFWREVVDRVAAEAPDTLLLAEAFWLMEGYFVRTLGMHRVYNSAFMNMLRDEDNAKYRSVMKNTLEFDTQILKRFVNFMNNPDERTAIDQFGKEDKYFGICVLMSTLPGLPMFGHGQVEGFTEKYGMEYRRAYWEESVDEHLVWRHEREIFPLLHRRRVFAEAHNFLLYDFYAPEGHVNEDVFAYSNRHGDERGLVIYHNKFADARGWVRTSAAFAVKGPDGQRTLTQRCLGEGLGLRNDGQCYVIFRDQITGLEFIRSSKEIWERGLYVELGAYKYQVFLDFREVEDNAWHQYGQLCAYLNGRGVPSIDEALREVVLQPVRHPFEELVNAGQFDWIIAHAGDAQEAVLGEVEGKLQTLLQQARTFTGGQGDAAAIAGTIRRELEVLLRLPADELPTDDAAFWGTVLGWLCSHALGRVLTEADVAEQSRAWLDEWLLGRILAGTLRDLGLEEHAAWHSVGVIGLLITHQGWMAAATEESAPYRVLEGWLRDGDVQRYLQVNRHQGVLWFSKEAFEQWLDWMRLIAHLTLQAAGQGQTLPACLSLLTTLQQAAEASGYQVERLLERVEELVEA